MEWSDKNEKPSNRSSSGGRGQGPPAGGRGGIPPKGGPGGPSKGGDKPKKKGGIWLQALSGNDFALSHPKCVLEMEPDFEEGIELWNEGDFEAARDALRYALQGCGDNMWVHVALGRIALEEDKDAGLARGHFGYAFELAEKAIPRDFSGRLPTEHPSNRPLFDAIDGLIACYEALGQPQIAEEVRVTARKWSTGKGGGPRPLN